MVTMIFFRGEPAYYRAIKYDLRTSTFCYFYFYFAFWVRLCNSPSPKNTFLNALAASSYPLVYSFHFDTCPSGSNFAPTAQKSSKQGIAYPVTERPNANGRDKLSNSVKNANGDKSIHIGNKKRAVIDHVGFIGNRVSYFFFCSCFFHNLFPPPPMFLSRFKGPCSEER